MAENAQISRLRPTAESTQHGCLYRARKSSSKRRGRSPFLRLGKRFDKRVPVPLQKCLLDVETLRTKELARFSQLFQLTPLDSLPMNEAVARPNNGLNYKSHRNSWMATVADLASSGGEPVALHF